MSTGTEEAAASGNGATASGTGRLPPPAYHQGVLDVHRLTLSLVESLAHHSVVFADRWRKERERVLAGAIAEVEMAIALDVFRDIVFELVEGRR